MSGKVRQNTVQLKPAEEKRMDEIFNYFAKCENNFMKFSEFFLFTIDRSIVSPRMSFSNLYELFLDCTDEIEKEKEREQQKEKVSPSKQQQQQQSKYQEYKEKGLNKQQYNYLLQQLSKEIFINDKNHLQKMFNLILSEKTIATKDQIEVARVPIQDEINRKLLYEQTIIILNEFEQELQNCFVTYMSENLTCSNGILIFWKEIALQQKKLTSYGLLHFLKDAHIVPNIISVEQVQECMMKVLPSVNNKENEFYHKHQLVQIYEKELDQGFDKKSENDPRLHFYEFQLLLARLGFELNNRQDEKRDIETILRHFFSQTIGLRANNEIDSKPFPLINKKLFQKLNKFYIAQAKQAQEEKQYEESESGEENEEEEEEIEEDTLMQQLAEEQEKLIFNSESQLGQMSDIFEFLNKELPPLPDLPAIKSENPPPYIRDANAPQPKKKKKKKKKASKKPEDLPQMKVIIGDPVPKPPPEKGQKQKPKPPKKKQLKRGEKPPRKIVFAGYPPPPDKDIYNCLQEQNDELEFGIKNLEDVDRGTMSEINIIPIIIDEIIYPPNDIPLNARTLLEAAINFHNQQNYYLALQNFENSKNEWAKEEARDLTENVNLFFEYSKGSVWLSAGRQDQSLQQYFICKGICDKLAKISYSPDRALAYCGLGSVLYELEEYALALRSYLKAREIREQFFGIEHVDTATIYNNLGCCMLMMNRVKESLAYFNISLTILESELGGFHPRVQTVMKNINKGERCQQTNIPIFHMLWETYEIDLYKKKPKQPKNTKNKKR